MTISLAATHAPTAGGGVQPFSRGIKRGVGPVACMEASSAPALVAPRPVAGAFGLARRRILEFGRRDPLPLREFQELPEALEGGQLQLRVIPQQRSAEARPYMRRLSLIIASRICLVYGLSELTSSPAASTSPISQGGVA
jgi:hypothetical protein